MDTLTNLATVAWELKWWLLGAYVVLVAIYGYEMGIAPVVDDDDWN